MIIGKLFKFRKQVIAVCVANASGEAASTAYKVLMR